MLLNHVLLRTRDSEAMIAFFTDIVGLEQGHRPPFAFDGAWLYSGHSAVIHLVDSDPADAAQSAYLGGNTTTAGTGIVDHLAFSGDDYSALRARLERFEYEYFERTVPESGEHQVFIQGPENLRVEVVFDANRRALSG